MTIGHGLTINSTDFINIYQKFYNVFGHGSAMSGYGQNDSRFTIESGTVISKNAWSLLYADMIKARQHQTGTTVGNLLTNDGNNLYPVTNELITNEIIEQYDNFANIIVNNKFSVADSQLSSAVLVDASRSTPWNNKITHTITVSASDAGDGAYNNFRYFFNAGGRLQFNVGRNEGSSSAKNSSWSEMLSSIGTISFNYNSTTKSGTKGTINSVGFYALTAQDQLLYTISGSGTYSRNTFNMFARLSSNNKLIFSLIFTDDVAEEPIDQDVNGYLYSKLTAYKPSGNNVAVQDLTAIHAGLTDGVVGQNYALLPVVTTVTEGGSSVIKIVSNDLTPRTIYWTTIGNVSSIDFDDNILYGSISLDSTGSGTLTRNIRADKISENVNDGPEYYGIQFRTGSITGTVIATTPSINIEDTSVYELTVDKTSVNEGDSVTYTITSTSVADGTTLYITIDGLNAVDIVGGKSTTRTVTIQNGSASGSITILKDWIYSENERFVIQARSGTTSGAVVATSPKITVIDTTPVVKTTLDLYASSNKSTTLSTVGNGSWFVPNTLINNIVYAKIYGGAGGGGGYHAPTCDSKTTHDGANGGNGYVIDVSIPVNPGENISYSIGSGGIGGGFGQNGGKGGESYFKSSTYSAAGGTGGESGGIYKNGVKGTGNAKAANGTGGTGVSGGTGGKHRVNDPIGDNGSNGRIELHWKELNNAPSITANSLVNYKITATNTANGTVLYVTMIGAVVAGDIVGGLSQTVTVNNGVASGSYTVANITNFGTKNASLQVRINSYSGQIVSNSEPFDIIGSGRTVFGTTGNHTFTAPNGIKSLTVTYPGPSGYINSNIAVTPGETLNITIGGVGETSSIKNKMNIPAFSKKVFTFSGNVDHTDHFDVKMYSTSGTSYSGTGKAAAHATGCSALGISLLEHDETLHGDLNSTITVNPVKSEIMTTVSNLPCKLSLDTATKKGRGTFSISQQPSPSNDYLGKWNVYDPDGGEGNYYYELYLNIVSYVIISW